jgi:hypothetical protein
MTKRIKKSIGTRRRQKIRNYRNYRNYRKKTLRKKKIIRGGSGIMSNLNNIYPIMLDFINAKNHGNIDKMKRKKRELLAVLPTTDLTDVDGDILMQLVIQSTDEEIRASIFNNETFKLTEGDILPIRLYVDQLIDEYPQTNPEEEISPERFFATETSNKIAIIFPQLFPHLNQNSSS